MESAPLAEKFFPTGYLEIAYWDRLLVGDHDNFDGWGSLVSRGFTPGGRHGQDVAWDVDEGRTRALAGHDQAREGRSRQVDRAPMLHHAPAGATDAIMAHALPRRADRLVELNAGESRSAESVRRPLKNRPQAVAATGMVSSHRESCGILAPGRAPGPVR